jgi:hypothetical protein
MEDARFSLVAKQSLAVWESAASYPPVKCCQTQLQKADWLPLDLRPAPSDRCCYPTYITPLNMTTLQRCRAVGSPGISWRVGVHLSGDAAAKWGLSSVRALVKPAVMRMEMSEADDSVRLFLHQADCLTGVIEVDREGRVCKTGCCAFHQPGAPQSSCAAAGIHVGYWVLPHNQQRWKPVSCPVWCLVIAQVPWSTRPARMGQVQQARCIALSSVHGTVETVLSTAEARNVVCRINSSLWALDMPHF